MEKGETPLRIKKETKREIAQEEKRNLCVFFFACLKKKNI
jgi:hypothetical protein